MHAVLLTTDLMLISAAQGVADRAGVVLATASSAEDAIEACSASSAKLLAVDLRTPKLDITRLMDDLRGQSGRDVFVLAAGPHVHEQLLNAAAAAGCDEVSTRGQFEHALANALGRLASPKAS